MSPPSARDMSCCLPNQGARPSDLCFFRGHLWVYRSTPSLKLIHIFLSDAWNLPLGEEGCWESLRFSPRTKVCSKLGVSVTPRMVRFVCDPALPQILGAFGQVRSYLRKNGKQGRMALPRLSVSHAALVEDGIHLLGTESSEI